MASTSSTINVIFDGAVAGLRAAATAASRALGAVRRSAADADGTFRDANGRLRDLNGRFVAAGDASGRFGASLRGITKALSVAVGAVKGLTTALRSALTLLASAGKALAVVGAIGAAGAGATTVIGALGSALAGIAPALLLLPGALLAGGAAMATFKIATAGFGEALAAADPAAFIEATKDMAPAARDAAAAVRGLREPFEEVQRAVQARFFDGFATQIQELGGTYLPILGAQLPRIAEQFNQLGRGIFAAFSTQDVQADFNNLLAGTAVSLQGIGPAAGDALAGILKLGSFGVGQFGGLGEAIAGAAARFREFVTAGVESGSFLAAIERMKVVFGQLGEIGGNVGDTIKSIFTGLSGGVGAGAFLENLVQITGALREFFATAAAQEALGALGETFRVVAGVLGEVLLTALRAIGPVITAVAPLVQQLAVALGGALTQAINLIAPQLPVLIGAFLQLVTALTPLIPTLAQIVTALIPPLAAGIAALAPLVGPLIAALGQLLTSALVPLVPVLAQVAQQLIPILTQAIQQLAPVMPQIVAAFGQILVAVIPLIPPLLNLAITILPILADIISNVVVPALNILVPVFNFLVSAITVGVEFIGVAIGHMTEFLRSGFENAKRQLDDIVAFFGKLGQIPQIVGRFIGDAVAALGRGMAQANAAVGQGVQAILGFFQRLGSQVLGALSGFVAQMFTVGRNIITGIINGLSSAGGAVISFLRDLAARALASVKSVLGIASPSRVFKDQVGEQIGAGLAAGIKASIPGVIDQARALTDAATEAASPGRIGIGVDDASRFVAAVQGAGSPLAGFAAAAGQASLNLAAAPATPDDTAALLRELIAAQRDAAARETSVFIGQEKLDVLIGAQVSERQRAIARTARAGAGVTF